MATKNQETINLIDIFSEFKDFKRIDKQTFINVLEDSFRSVIARCCLFCRCRQCGCDLYGKYYALIV